MCLSWQSLSNIEILAYLFFKASKWLSRQNAIQSIAAHVESGRIESCSSEVQLNSSCLLKVVKEHTRGFKETNVNIMKAIIRLFAALCEYHEAKEIAFPSWATHEGVVLAVHKISDRKLSSRCKDLLTKLCVVSDPSSVLDTLVKQAQSAKSPIVHEESLRWFQGFSEEFGALSVGSNLSSLIPWIIEVNSVLFFFPNKMLCIDRLIFSFPFELRRLDHRTRK